MSSPRNASGRQAWAGSTFRDGFRVRVLPHRGHALQGVTHIKWLPEEGIEMLGLFNPLKDNANRLFQLELLLVLAWGYHEAWIRTQVLLLSNLAFCVSFPQVLINLSPSQAPSQRTQFVTYGKFLYMPVTITILALYFIIRDHIWLKCYYYYNHNHIKWAFLFSLLNDHKRRCLEWK